MQDFCVFMVIFMENNARTCVCQKIVVPLRPFLFCLIVRICVRHMILLVCLLCAMAAGKAYSQSLPEGKGDSIATADSIATPDSISLKPQPKSSGDLKSPIHYQASDSMVMMADGTAFLHGKGEMKYERMELTSAMDDRVS